MATKMIHQQRGFSLINMMIGLFLVTLLTAGAMSLLSQARTGVGNNVEDQRVVEINRVLTQVSSHIERGGVVSNGMAAAVGRFQLCSFRNNTPNCMPFNPDQNKGFCLQVPVQNESLGFQAVEYYGVRLLNGVLEERTLSTLTPGQADLSQFCRNNQAWSALHDDSTFRIENLRICKLPTTSLGAMLADYTVGNNCESVINTQAQSNVDNNPAHWILVMNFFPFKSGETGVTLTRILQLFNHPQVVTL